MTQKDKTKVKPNAKGNQVLRFDVELTADQFAKFDAICTSCYRNRKNFSEALILLAIDRKIDLSPLGVINQTS